MIICIIIYLYNTPPHSHSQVRGAAKDRGNDDKPRRLVVIIVGVDRARQSNDKPTWLVVVVVGADRARQSNDKPTWLVVVVIVGADRARRTQDEPRQAYAACRRRCVSPKVGTMSLHGLSASLT